MELRIKEALRSSKADYTEIRIEQREETDIIFRGKDLETANAVIDLGGIVRCLCRDGGWGVATFNDLSDLPTWVEQAYECARLAQSEEPIELAPIPVSEDRITAALDHDFRGISMSDKKALAESYNNLLLGHHPSIVDTTTRYNDVFSRVWFGNSEGTVIHEERPMVTARMLAVARDGDNVQRPVRLWLCARPGAPGRSGSPARRGPVARGNGGGRCVSGRAQPPPGWGAHPRGLWPSV
jgi:TldD protein